jgi:cell division protein FtsW
MDDWRNTLIPAVLPTLVFIGLIVFQPDLGTAIACAAITICVLLVAGLDLKYLAYAFVGSLLPLYFLIFHVAYRRDRILAFLNPYSDPQGKGFHIIQSLIAVFLWRGTRTALHTPDLFGRFLAVGITSMVVVQAFINVSVVLGLMPTKGIPLPLISYGGSSLFITLGCIGVLLNITKQAE